MDWNSKTYHHHQHLAALSGSGTVMNNIFSVDLKLGRLEDKGDLSLGSTGKNSGALPSNMASSNSRSSSSKKGRIRNGRAQTTVTCLVDGCNSDLSDCREYYRRHRVCERHSKTPVVLIGGNEQRFCQQCSRFQSLGEFDEVKRSCRKRLEGHNRRRRKTQPETFYMTSTGLQSSYTQTGNRLLQFWSPQTNTANRPVISQPEKALYYSHHEHHTSLPDSLSWSTSCTKGEKQYTLLSDMNHQTVHQPLLIDTAPMGTTRDGIQVSPDRLTQSVRSECALSLLSNYPTQSSAGTYTGHIIMQQPMMTSSSAEGIGTALHLEDESSVSLSSTSTNHAHSFGAFPSGHNGLCENGSSRIFPFAWE